VRGVVISTSLLTSIVDPGGLPPGNRQLARCTLIDVETSLKETRLPAAALAILLAVAITPPMPAQGVPAQQPAAQPLAGQDISPPAGPPPSSGGIFPLSEVRRGMTGTAWTVFEGSTPEPMQVEILGVLRGARGPGQDLILAQLRGARPEYTGVVEGMSGSPVYIGGKLLGSLSYRIGQFSKDPIAGITPIEQMFEARSLPVDPAQPASDASNPASGMPASGWSGSATPDAQLSAGNMNFQAMETPLVMSGFHPEALEFWQRQMIGTSLETVAAGGMAGSQAAGAESTTPTPALQPGSAVSALLVRGDLEISATCTVTYIDPRQLLACGHPILQAGPVSLPMTTAEVITTLASPLNAFKIINTGNTVGAFTEDRESAIRGVMGARALMIPVHIAMDGPGDNRKLNVEILDLPSLTPQALEVVLYESLLETNASTFSTSYHLTGSIDVEGFPPVPLDLWASAGGLTPAPMQLAALTGGRFNALYSSGARQGTVLGIDLRVETIPRRVAVELVGARLVSSNIVHAGDTIDVEATVRPWQQPARNVRIAIKLPARLDAGNLRLLVSDGVTLDRTLNQPRLAVRRADLAAVLEQARRHHPEDRVYVSLLVPEAQAGIAGETLLSVPLSVANALEPLRAAETTTLNGESAELAGQAPAGGVLNGFQILDLHIDPGGGLN